MNRSTTAREALVAELIGDLAKLLDRVEALDAAMNDSRVKLADCALRLGARVEPIKAHVAAATIRSQQAAVEHIRRRTAEIAAESLGMQIQAMNAAARAIVDQEVAPPLRQLASTLQVLIERTRRPQWQTWATYAATACLSGILAASLSIYLVGP